MLDPDPVYTFAVLDHEIWPFSCLPLIQEGLLSDTSESTS